QVGLDLAGTYTYAVEESRMISSLKTTTLAVDVGQTSSRLLLTHADGRVERWTGAGGRAGRPVEAELLALLGDEIGKLGATAPIAIDTVSAGLTGLQGRPARAADVLDEL